MSASGSSSIRQTSGTPPYPGGEQTVPDEIISSMQRTASAVNILVTFLVVVQVLTALAICLGGLMTLLRGRLDAAVIMVVLLLLLGASYTIPTLLLRRYRAAIAELAVQRRERELVLALRAQRWFWTYIGCAVLILSSVMAAMLAYLLLVEPGIAATTIKHSLTAV